eukprot:TRINITY_DN32063_c0_g1_i6.p1 TRINITY_DN32063_c0_g1~~TRINITY_DN32063_c0_g1_i6.p1  ORF type:complete len:216 (-),score=15.67 TRINITY_DN32063_c0_g1_i6:248-850(-)
MTVTVSTGTLLPGTPSQPGRRRRALRILPHNGASYVTRLLLGGTLTSAALQRSYAAAPGNLPTCKNFAQAQCFDQQYTCDRCCDTRAIPTGDMSCWLNEIEFALCCGVTQMRMQAQAMLPPVHVEGKATSALFRQVLHLRALLRHAKRSAGRHGLLARLISDGHANARLQLLLRLAALPRCTEDELVITPAVRLHCRAVA